MRQSSTAMHWPVAVHGCFWPACCVARCFRRRRYRWGAAPEALTFPEAMGRGEPVLSWEWLLRWQQLSDCNWCARLRTAGVIEGVTVCVHKLAVRLREKM